MSLEREDPLERVERVAALARLALPRAGREELAREFERILAAFEGLAALDVEGVEPLHSPAPPPDVEREDRPQPSLEREALLAPAPDPRGGFFGVPRTIGGDA